MAPLTSYYMATGSTSAKLFTMCMVLMIWLRSTVGTELTIAIGSTIGIGFMTLTKGMVSTTGMGSINVIGSAMGMGLSVCLGSTMGAGSVLFWANNVIGVHHWPYTYVHNG